MDGQGWPRSAQAGRDMRAVERLAPHRIAEVWTDQAANGLFRKHPEFSARTGITPGQKLAAMTLTLLAFSTIALFPASGWTGLQLAFALGFSALIALRLTAAACPPRWNEGPKLDDDELPIITILAPVYQEASVLDQLTQALAAIDYPVSRLDIKIIMEADDRETIKAARHCVFDSRFELVIVPPGLPRTKPRALNYGLHFARGDIVTVYDAEDVPHPGQLRAAAAAFAAGDTALGCVQAPLNWYNHDRNWLTRQFALEYAIQFHAILPLLARLGLPLPLGGTSNHFRREALEAAGGWDAYNVTEDADLGFRLARLGYRSDVISLPTMEEAPENLGPWIRQRSRWLKGYLQSLAVQLRQPRHLPLRAMISLSLTLGAAVISAFLHGPAIMLFLGLLIMGNTASLPAAGLLACGYAASALCAAVAIRRAGLETRAADLARMPLYWPLQAVAMLRALRELRDRPYFWAKTEHGFTKAPQPACPLPSPSSCKPSLSQLLPSAPGGQARIRTRQKVRA
ncbi:glycosyltransferase [Hyphobacterium sp.]|uniref:glycosyltransferase n=1 Tax=Hyphobacterium sp. TaxID=2004662 RepID=UPI003BA8C13C